MEPSENRKITWRGSNSQNHFLVAQILSLLQLIIKYPIISFNSQLKISPKTQVNNTMFTLNPKDMQTTASTLFSAYASFAASMMLVRSITDQLIPHQFRSYIYSVFSHFFTTPSSNLTLIV
ncbi:hypothetical protein RchiOBHm_Chr2g0099801 [Rosa chinensis]|uniref:Uncharacterized protein n=1 Tax=Rosa chinensis TaxID=74649 RepID=A0A2P6RM26_ROSCH|nr:hypothetical protein RchiOBHm_Chr2g0099801 [Rosa chinensis]